MRGKVTVSLQTGSSTTLSALTFLREGVTAETNHVLESLTDSIVCQTQQYISQLTKLPTDNSDSNLKKLYEGIQDQIGCLANLIINFPELSFAIMFKNINLNLEGFPHILHIPRPNITFLGLFLRYACYIYNFEVSYFIESLIEKTKDEIFVEVDGESLPLKALNELIVFEEIIAILEETVTKPESLLKTIYSVSIWSIFSQISITLLSLPVEKNQKNFKLEIIQKLYSCCLRAIEAYKPIKVNDSENHISEDEIKIVYVFMVRLAPLDMALQAKSQLIQCNDSSEVLPMTPNQLHWAHSLIREQSYRMKEEIPQQLSSKNAFSQPNTMSLRQEAKLIGYKPASYPITLKNFFSKSIIYYTSTYPHSKSSSFLQEHSPGPTRIYNRSARSPTGRAQGSAAEL